MIDERIKVYLYSIVVFKKRIENENFCWEIGIKLGNYFFQEILWKDYNNDLI